MIVLIVYLLPIKRIIQRCLWLLNHLGTKGKHVLINVLESINSAEEG